MLEKPDLPDAKIIACLQEYYGLHIAQLTFLPLGADVNTVVYRVVTNDKTPYFLKLRSGVFETTSVLLPHFLHDQGITQIIAPVPTTTQQLWATLDDFNVILYPFVEGHNGYEVQLSDEHWVTFGAALKRIHTASIPLDLKNQLQRETYSAHWREIVRGFMARVETDIFTEPTAAKLATFLRSKKTEILHLVERAEQLGWILQSRPLEFVVCHADMHIWNILIDTHDTLYIVDWDTLILAPKERDLMFVGGGLFANRRTAQQEEMLFYQGYGQTEVNFTALAYYRYERIVQDVTAYCSQILLTDEGGEDREEGLRQLMSQFLAGGVVEMAQRTEAFLPTELKTTS